MKSQGYQCDLSGDSCVWLCVVFLTALSPPKINTGEVVYKQFTLLNVRCVSTVDATSYSRLLETGGGSRRCCNGRRWGTIVQGGRVVLVHE